MLKRQQAGPAPEESRSRTLQRRHTPTLSLEEITAADFHDGSFLRKFFAICVHTAIKAVGRPTFAPQTHNVGSVCTGSAQDAMVLDAVEYAFEADNIPVDFNVPFTCEMVSEKGKWISKVHQALKSGCPVPCNFDALQDPKY